MSQLTISVSGTVNVAVVTRVRLVLDVCGVDGDTTSLLLGCTVNLRVVREGGTTLAGQNLGNSRSERGLSVVDVTWLEIVSEMYRTV